MQATVDIRELQERIERESSFVDALTMGMNHVIVGQKHLVESLLIGLLADGHILLEGVPGLAKTLAIKTLAQLVKADFSRIQFTPDLLPADVVGTRKRRKSLKSNKVQSSLTLYWQMRLTVLLRKCNQHSWRRCKSAKSLSVNRPTSWVSHSWYWQPKTLSNKKELTHYQKHKPTVSCSKW